MKTTDVISNLPELIIPRKNKELDTANSIYLDSYDL